ncbi:MFS transporter, FSR family, fosmidomycin resistance protein [Granulicella pectinivorans]|jgi:FSR family fosmidomycin resistance protein-like MFS transporter|uniref:MFS transporter, FSR family, fosmidomycin resistance protein n=1 Tax=Granulicella pectinivorans TaxID=474950 RepID=A0A1I6LYD2_9BACT|nr:MFS transporter [Granulicella pectinivorans]SFS08440.1 MFS transporter, FSR family, fosmidomycin resistance protein [Granulicella pectinivorans]
MSENTLSSLTPAAILPATPVQYDAPPQRNEGTLLRVLGAISFCHLLNDMVQSLLPSIYPILKSQFHLDFAHLGLLTFTYQVVASMLQPLVGQYTDKHPMPFALPTGMTFTLIGLILLAFAPTFTWLIVAASLVGVGSAIFHPESSRIARMASGGKHGFAQSFFQVGGNSGSAIGPLLAAFIVLPLGQKGMAWFTIPAIVGIAILYRIGRWYKQRHAEASTRKGVENSTVAHLSRGRVIMALAILIALIFSKYFYLASLSSYYTFYLIQRFQVSVRTSQIMLFAFLGAVAAGTLIGGSAGDRWGRKLVIWISILGVLPFTLILPYASLFWTGVLSVIIGFIIASAFSAILVYAQELLPGRVGMVSGLFFGVAFGMGGIGAAVLGKIADRTSIITVYHLCAYLPAIGLLTGFLPDVERKKPKTRKLANA